MKFTETLKNLPLLSLLAFSLAASPGLSLAGDNTQGHDKNQHSRESASYGGKKSDEKRHQQQNIKHTNKQHQAANANSKKGHYEPKYAYNRHYEKRHNSYQHNQHGHSHAQGHSHHYAHNHHENHAIRYQRNVIVEERQYRDLRDIRLMLGLHTNNFDIIFRD